MICHPFLHTLVPSLPHSCGATGAASGGAYGAALTVTIVRDPVRRLESAWRYYTKLGVLRPMPIEAILNAAEPGESSANGVGDVGGGGGGDGDRGGDGGSVDSTETMMPSEWHPNGMSIEVSGSRSVSAWEQLAERVAYSGGGGGGGADAGGGGGGGGAGGGGRLVVLVADRFDESLVMLGDIAGMALEELTYRPIKPKTPTEAKVCCPLLPQLSFVAICCRLLPCMTHVK